MCNKAFLTILSLWFSEVQKEKKHKQKRNIIIYDENAAMAEAFYFVSSFAATEQFPTEKTCFKQNILRQSHLGEMNVICLFSQ